MKRYRVCLTIAGFDGSGGAGLQADLKTFMALGCYGTSVLTSLPIQNTTGVRRVEAISEGVVRDQLETVCGDIRPDALKIGMVHSRRLVRVISSWLERQKNPPPVVLDPVMVATSGDLLMEDGVVEAIRSELIPLATITTPNLREAEVLSGQEIQSEADMISAGHSIRANTASSLLIKSGKWDPDKLVNLWFDREGEVRSYPYRKITTRNTHGTGCTLSSAIAAFLAMDYGITEAVERGQSYVHLAIQEGADVRTGAGMGPLNHSFSPQPLIKR